MNTKVSRRNHLSAVANHFFLKGYLQGKSTLKLNSSAYEKYEYGHLGCWYIKLKQIFPKNKVVTGKNPLFVIGAFSSCHSSCLNIGF